MNKAILLGVGIHYDAGVERFSGHGELYENYLRKFLTCPDFSNLCAAMETGDHEAAFRCAHTLKGIVGNLSMDSLYEKIRLFTELLRGQADLPRAEAEFPALRAAYRETADAVAAYFA